MFGYISKTKKKELVDDFENSGCEWQKQETPEIAQIYNFMAEELGYELGSGNGSCNNLLMS